VRREAVPHLAGHGFRGLVRRLAARAPVLEVLDDRGASTAFPARPASEAGGDFVVRVPVTELPAGLWEGRVRLGPWTVPLPSTPLNLAPAKWRRRGLPWYAKPAVDDSEAFTLRVARTDLVRAVTRRLNS
jgi:CDP-glycerol glycerophosphotransferase